METELKVAAVKSSSEEEIMDIHQQMGHPSFYLLKHMYSHLFKNIDISTIVCDACQLGKFKRTTFPPTDHRKTIPFQLIHFDVWGPSPQTDILGKRYFLVCTDDYSRYSWLFLLKDKTEVTSNIKNLCKLIKRQFGEDVKGIRTDNARDFLNTELKEFLESKRIKHETSCPYTPQQNGLAERKIGDIVDKSRTLLIQGNVPTNLWGFAVMTAIHLINRLPSKVLDLRSPIDLLEECFPNIKLKTSLPVKVFGCVCYVHNPKYKQNKWNAKALKCVFLGYSTTQKGYKAYHPLTRKYIVSKDVLFEEKCFYYKPIGNESHREIDRLLISENLLINDSHLLSDSSPLVDAQSYTELGLELPQISLPTDTISNLADDTHTIISYPKYYQRKKGKKLVASYEIPIPHVDNNPVISGELLESAEGGDGSNQNSEILSSERGGNDLPIALRKGTRSCVKPIPFAMTSYLNYQNVSPQYKTFLTHIQEIPITKNPQEALSNTQWKAAMDEEMKALLQNDTWEVVDLPREKKTVGCKWVYTLKYKSDGSLDRYKARLVARGYTQTYGIDYQETFAPVTRINIIRILISLVVNLDWPLYQYDIKNAFLHGDLNEEIYMNIPPGYEGKMNEGKVRKLKKALYGLKQSPRAWFGRFT